MTHRYHKALLIWDFLVNRKQEATIITEDQWTGMVLRMYLREVP